MRFLELFAGAGGLSMGLEAAGMACVGHAEIEPHARAVLRYAWRDVPLYGDVTQLNGADLMAAHPFDVLTGGSPCQDLSVAGKRAGLSGARSSLFHVQHRLWMESGAPYLLWENVFGAFSSNRGADFATVLSTLVGAAVPVPADGWRRGGVASGPDAVAAWRVLDLQYVPGRDRAAPPQRRVRVFVLAARAGGVDPAEVLALGESVCGHPAPRAKAGQGAAGDPAGGAGGGVGAWSLDGERNARHDVMGTIVRPPAAGGHRRACVVAFDSYNQRCDNVDATLSHGESGRPIAFHLTQHPICGAESPALGTTTYGMGVVSFAMRGREGGATPEVSDDGTGRGTPIIVASGQTNAETRTDGGAWSLDGERNARHDVMGTRDTGSTLAVLACAQNSRDEVRVIGGEVAQALCAEASMKQQNYVLVHDARGNGDGAEVVRTLTVGGRDQGAGDSYDNTPVVCVTGDTTHALTHEGADASEDGTGRGTPIVAYGDSGMGRWAETDVAITLAAQDHKGGNTLAFQGLGRPRRLTPLECERLMAWPETGILLRFEACLDHPESRAHAVALSLKSLSVAGRAEVAVHNDTALCVVRPSLPSAPTLAPAVVARVVISICSRQIFVSLSNGESSFVAKSVDWNEKCDRLVALARTALSNASSLGTKASAVPVGAAACQTSATNSTRAERGSESLVSCGSETSNASDAVLHQSEAGRQLESYTTSEAGKSSQNFDWTWTTLCCSVADAISGFIRDTMSGESLFACELIVSDGHTAVGIDEQGREYRVSDTARYRLCGNGVGSTCTEWIGRRLMALEAMAQASERQGAA